MLGKKLDCLVCSSSQKRKGTAILMQCALQLVTVVIVSKSSEFRVPLYFFFCETQHIRHFSVSGKEVSCPMSICCCAHLWSERWGLVHVHRSAHHGSLLMACWRWHTSLVSHLWDTGNAQLCLCSTRRPPWRKDWHLLPPASDAQVWVRPFPELPT